MKENSRALTINFMDGTKVSYGFPEQGMNSAAKQLKIEEFMKNPFLMVLAWIVIVMLMNSRSRRRRRVWGTGLPGILIGGASGYGGSRGGFGGGFGRGGGGFSGGGGRSGGGGASGRW